MVGLAIKLGKARAMIFHIYVLTYIKVVYACKESDMILVQRKRCVLCVCMCERQREAEGESLEQEKCILHPTITKLRKVGLNTN